MAQIPPRGHRAPGSFSPMPGSSFSSTAAAAAAASSATSSSSRPGIRRIDTSSSEDSASVYQPKTRTPQTPVSVTSPGAFPFGQHHNSSSSSLHNFSRPVRPSDSPASAARNASPLAPPGSRGHSRKHSHSQGHFEPFLPSASMSNLSQISMPPPQTTAPLSASQIAAQAAMQIQHQQVPILQHPVSRVEQQQQQAQQGQLQHNRHRSQTVPFPGSEVPEPPRRQPPPKPTPPMLSLTEASVPRDHALAAGDQVYRNGLLGSQSANAAAAASTVFNKSPVTSPSFPDQPPPLPEKPAKTEKSKVKLFSRPKKIETKSETREKPLPSPGKIGSALASLQRGNYSTTSLADPSPAFYNMANSSSATIRAVDSTDKEKEKKPHFLSRQKHKLTAKDDYHLPLSSAASNSRPVDPNAPASLYNFNLPPSPGPNSGFSKSVSGLDLRHGGRALREKRKEDKLDMRLDNESSHNVGASSDWAGPSSVGTATPSFFDSVDGSRYGLHNMSLDDAWPYLRAKLLAIFEGEDLRITIEDLNRVVTMHIQYCIVRRSSYIIIDDLRDLLATGFASLDHTLRKTPEDRLIPALVELWLFTFTSILPYLQAVFLPLDLEFQGCGPLLGAEQARDFWGGVLAASPAPGTQPSYEPASNVLDVRRLVLTAYRDKVILPRYDKLKTIFSRLSLEHLPSSFGSLGLHQPPPLHDGMGSLSSSPSDYYGARPGTAMSLDPSNGSYNSSSTTLFGEGSNPSRSRAISNVSYASGGSDPMSVGTGGGASQRPFTPQAGAGITLGSLREQNVEDSKQITEMVGRMLQCMSVLASVGNSPGNGLADPSSLSASVATTSSDPSASTATASAIAFGQPLSKVATNSSLSGADEGSKMMLELGRLLKLNWLGRGRTGRNRRGMVGGRVKRIDPDAAMSNSLRSHHRRNSSQGYIGHSRGNSAHGGSFGGGGGPGSLLAQSLREDGVGVVG